MRLPMSDAEIAMRYRNAINPKAAVKILAQLNAASQSDIRAVLAREGIFLEITEPKRKPRKRLDQERAQEMYGQGMNDHEIADRLGVSSSAVYHWRYRNNLPPHTGTGYHKRRKTGAVHSG